MTCEEKQTTSNFLICRFYSFKRIEKKRERNRKGETVKIEWYIVLCMAFQEQGLKTASYIRKQIILKLVNPFVSDLSIKQLERKLQQQQ